jgi:hypothetical protein
MKSATEDPARIGERLLQRAWNRDGLPELAVGLTFLLVSASLWFQHALPKGTVLHTAAILSFAVGLPLLIFAARPLVLCIRNRWLVERAGYVEHLPPTPQRNRLFVPLAFMVAVLPLIGLASRYSHGHLPAAVGLAGAALWTAMGLKTREVRSFVCGLVMAATGIALGFSNLPTVAALAILFGSQGVLLVAMGAVVFVRFLRDTDGR